MSDEGRSLLECPAPRAPRRIVLGHGGGGSLMHALIDGLFRPALGNPLLDRRHDGAVLDLPPGRVALTTDSYVVRPLEFPGGDIGRLAVCGTVNDLAMCGARPICLSAGFILEEGLDTELLARISESMGRTAQALGVPIATGDTKVVDRGAGDGVFVNTTGVGVLEHELEIGPEAIRPGDAILLSGDVGRHGAAILASRESLGLELALESDCAPLWEPVAALLDAGLPLHCLRDLTRGGLATGLVELARDARLAIVAEEAAIPAVEPVRGLCELLGLDPLYVANEGRFVCVLPESCADEALAILQRIPVSAGAVRIGRIAEGPAGRTTLRSPIGGERVLRLHSGEQLPRIC